MAITFIVAMALMMGGLVSFLLEVQLALRLFYVDAEMLASIRATPTALP